MRRLLIRIIIAFPVLALNYQEVFAQDLAIIQRCTSKNLVECVLDKYLAILNREKLSKQREIDFIMRRYPGYDPSINIGMWTANRRAADGVQAYIERNLGQELGAAKEGIRTWNLVRECIIITPSQYDPLWDEANLLDRVIAAQELNFDSRESEKEAIMKRFPGFDASENIGRWSANVTESDRVQGNLDNALKSIKESASRVLTKIAALPIRC